jgi:hypothetical protein
MAYTPDPIIITEPADTLPVAMTKINANLEAIQGGWGLSTGLTTTSGVLTVTLL